MDTLALNKIILPFEECVSPSLPNTFHVGSYDFCPQKHIDQTPETPQFRCDWVCFKQVPSTQEFPRWWQLKYFFMFHPYLGGNDPI